MNVLYINLINNVYGHKLFDTHILNALAKHTNVFTITMENWYDESILDEKIQKIYSKDKEDVRNRLDLIKFLLSRILLIRKTNRTEKIDAVFISTFFIKILPVVLRLSGIDLSKVILIHHNTIDMLLSSDKTKEKFLKYANKTQHVVLEPFISEYLTNDLHVDNHRVHVVPHPLSGHGFMNSDKIYDCVGLSGSNDPSFIKRIIEIEKEKHVFKDKGLKVILKSDHESFDDGALTVFHGRIKDEVYTDYLTRAKSVYIPLPPSFRYRVSAVTIEAVVSGAFVIGSPVKLFEFYRNTYGGIFSVISTVEELVNQIQMNYTLFYDYNDREHFLNDHSDEIITDSLGKILDLFEKKH